MADPNPTGVGNPTDIIVAYANFTGIPGESAQTICGDSASVTAGSFDFITPTDGWGKFECGPYSPAGHYQVVPFLVNDPSGSPMEIACSPGQVSVAAGLPSCTLAAVPDSGTGPFSSNLTASFLNVADGTTIDFDCGVPGETGSGTVSGGTASFTCNYGGPVGSTTTYTATADDGATLVCPNETVTNYPPGSGATQARVDLQVEPLPLPVTQNFTKALAELTILSGPSTDAYIVAKILDPVGGGTASGTIVYDSSGSDVRALPANFSFLGQLGEQNLAVGNYRLSVEAREDGTGILLGSGSLPFEVVASGAVPVPETSLVLVALIAAAVVLILSRSPFRKE
jgi:hypothetical protein